MLAWVPHGTLRVDIAGRTYLVTHTRLLWVPANVTHTLRPSHDALLIPFMMPTDPDTTISTWTTVHTIRATGALHSLIRVLAQPALSTAHEYARALDQLLDVLPRLKELDIDVALPCDPRAATVATALIENPAHPRSLEEWAKVCYTSAKTLQRLFVQQTGVTFPEWRTRVRVRTALDLLHEGWTVHSVATRVGYSTASGFIAAFSRITGHTPARYMRENPKI